MNALGVISVLLICLIIQGMYAGAEAVLAGASRTRLERRSEEGDEGAKEALLRLADAPGFLATCLVGSTLALVSGVAVASTAIPNATPLASVLAVAAYVPLAVLAGEAIPRSIHRRRATELAPWAARLVGLSQWPFAPLLPVIRGWARVIQRASGNSERSALTREEILALLARPDEPGRKPNPQERMIARVIAIGEHTAEACMTPLVRMDAVSADATVADAIRVAVRHGHTRLPVYRERIDHIVGFVHARDLLFGAADDAPISSLLRPVKYFPESKRADELLHELRREKEQLAVLVDEYGGTTGMVTVEDLLEELIGDIKDERESDDIGIRRLSETDWRIAGKVSVSLLAETLGTPVPPGEYETVAGMVLHALGHIPRRGESVQIGDLQVRVEEATERAVTTVMISVQRRREQG